MLVGIQDSHQGFQIFQSRCFLYQCENSVLSLASFIIFKTKYSKEETRKMVTRKMLWADIQAKAFQSPGLGWLRFFLLTNQQGFPFSSKFAAKKQSLFIQTSPLQLLPSQVARIITLSALFIYKSVIVSFSFCKNQRKSWPKNTWLQDNPSQLKTCQYLRSFWEMCRTKLPEVQYLITCFFKQSRFISVVVVWLFVFLISTRMIVGLGSGLPLWPKRISLEDSVSPKT